MCELSSIEGRGRNNEEFSSNKKAINLPKAMNLSYIIGGQKMFVFVYAQGIKLFTQLREGGKNGKILST